MTVLEKLRTILAPGDVLSDDDMAPWCSDWLGLYDWTPIAVVCPRTTQEVAAVLKFTYEAGIPVVPVGGNTGITGATVAADALMLSLHRMTRIEHIRTDARVAIVEAGAILQDVRDAVGEHGLIFPMSFGARGSARIGGILSTNAGGSNVLRYGNSRDLCLGVEVVLPDGRVMDLMSELHKDNSGYALKHLFVGAEGTLGVITRAALKLFPAPQATTTAMVAPPDLTSAMALLQRIQEETGGLVDAFEYMPRRYITRHLEMFEDAREPFEAPYDVNIMVEVSATAARDARTREDGTVALDDLLEGILAEGIEQGLVLDAVVARSEQQRNAMWSRRELAAELFKGYVGNDVAVPLHQVAPFYEILEARIMEIDAHATIVSVSHLGDGNIHYSVYISQNDPALREHVKETVDRTAVELGGSFSAEHGVGIEKIASMSAHKDPTALDVMRALKNTLDPKGLMNPNKVLPH